MPEPHDHPFATHRVVEHHGRAMGSDLHVIVVGGPEDAVGVALHRIEELEHRWSRFLPGSEVARLNRRAGSWVDVSADTRLLVKVATEAHRTSGGSFDPSVLGDLIRAGYDRSFDAFPAEVAAGRSWLLPGCDDIEIDEGRVRLPAGTGFDPGGVGKGLAADLVAGEVLAIGAAGVCVNLGGDVRVAGTAPHDGAWTVAVDHAWSPRPLALLGLGDGAVATSTTLLRAWTVDGRRRHHLIDPATGEPSDSDLVHVTVVAGDAWLAEVLAKSVLLRGSDHPFDLLADPDLPAGIEALVADHHGRVQATPGLTRFLGPAVLPRAIAPPTAAA